ncbi:MAG: hypothetical protein AAGF12_05360 [Myxococcota bacterium]
MRRARRFAIVTLVVIGGFAVSARPAPATVAEQRARLPPPAECTDPVAGVWRSHRYDPRFHDWSQFTLEIHRDPEVPGRIFGIIRNHSWSGGPELEEPPSNCRFGMRRWVVSMDAEGTASDDGRIQFGGVGQWRLDERICQGWAGYNLDNFTGTIDPAIQEFQSVNNDGGRSVNEPTVFRRISCYQEDTPSEPHPNIRIEPPPMFPETSGCGCL